MDLLSSMGLIIITSSLFAFIIKFFKQPLIPAYILSGLLLGPITKLITNSDVISSLSTIGIAFLLFVVGMEIDFNKLKKTSLVSSVGGLVRMLLFFLSGFVIALLFGFKNIEAVYLGIIIAFSSTTVVVKLLSDKRELDTLHSRIMIGMLLVEDLVAIIILAIISSPVLSFNIILFSFLKVIALLFLSFLLSKYLLKPIFSFAAKSRELLFLVSLSVCFLFIILSFYLNVSIIIGAFIAGILIGNLPYNLEIASRIKPLRDFFAIIFFVSLGLGVNITSLHKIIPIVIALLFIIIILKPLITSFICSFFGYTKRTSLLTSIYLAQISAFGLIIAKIGFDNQHISENILYIAIIIAVFTMSISSYFINYSEKIYAKISKYFSFLDKFSTSPLEKKTAKKNYDIILCGYNRIGYSIVKTIKKMRKKLLVIDYNPDIIEKLKKMKIPFIYGDIGNIDILKNINFKNVKMVISTVPTIEDNLLLIKKVKEANKNTIVFVTANQIDEALELYSSGADYVILPHFLGGEHVSLIINKLSSNISNLSKIMEIKLEHIAELKRRKQLGHEHPPHQ